MTPVILFAIASAPASVLAEGTQLSILADLEYLYSETDSEDDDGNTLDTVFSRFEQKYDVDLQKEIYPFLSLRAGGVFELIDTDTTSKIEVNGIRSRIKSQRDARSTWLYGELNLENPLYTAGGAYRRREVVDDPGNFPASRDYRDEWAALFRWQPVGFPIFNLDFNRFHTWDDDDERDLLLDRLILKSRYSYRDFSYDYTYTRNDAENRIGDFDTLNQIHNGNVEYSRPFFDGRLLTNAGIRLNYQTLELSGEGDFRRPATAPGVSLFRQDDVPTDFWTNAELTDARNATSITIGDLIPPGDPASAGLIFAIETEVDTVYALPDTGGSLAGPEVIASVVFTWTVYISDDGLNWNEHLGADSIYDSAENRFEISFPAVETRYVKVVTVPQSSTDEIVIGEVQAFTTITVAGSEGFKLEDFDQTYNLGLQWAVTDRSIASYDGFFRMIETEPFDTRRTTLTNSISFRHVFNPRLFANARLLRTDTTETNRDDTVDHSYTASITADHLDTLRQTLVYSGRHNEGENETSSSNSIFLRTDADLYEGWSADLDLGYSWKNSDAGSDTTTTTLRIGTNVDPNPRLGFALDYRVSYNTESGARSGSFDSNGFDHNARFQGFWVPLRTLSFFAGVSLRKEAREMEGLQVDQNYSLNWAPFPDGLLEFSLGYNYSVDTRNNESSTLSPQIDWQVTRTTFLTARLNVGSFETENRTNDVMNIRVNLRTHY
jgi:hypothetical protein